jgi:Transcriptional regulator, AbiEi antitoxin/AbiEi antitoxin C-terminal domain
MASLELADVAAGQWGLITTAQAGGVGVSPQSVAKLARAGALERLAHGVYRLAGTPSGPFDELRAAWLALDPDRTSGERLLDDPPEVVSHRSAARLLGLGDVEADRHEFIVERRRQSRRPDVRFHRARLANHDWTLTDGLPVTTAARTIADLAVARIDGGHLASVVRDALVKQKADPGELAQILRHHAHVYGAPLGGGDALLARLLAEAGIPEITVRTAELPATNRAALLPQSKAMAARLNAPEARRIVLEVLQASGPEHEAIETIRRDPRLRALLASLTDDELHKLQEAVNDAERQARRTGR